MAGEEQEQVVQEQQVVENDTTGDDDMEAGFNRIRGVTETPPTEPENQPPVEPPVPEPEPPRLAQITEDQFNQLMTAATEYREYKAETGRQLDRVNGSLGNFKQRLDGLGSGDISAEDFAELKDEFPDLVEPMLKGFQKAAGRTRSAAPDTAAIDKMIEEKAAAKFAEARTEMIDATLDSVIGGDWRAEVNTDKFRAWSASQPADVQALGASVNLRDASRFMSLFKAHRDAPRAPAPTPANSRNRQVSAAVNPRSAGGFTAPAKTEDDEIEEGFNRARG